MRVSVRVAFEGYHKGDYKCFYDGFDKVLGTLLGLLPESCFLLGASATIGQ